MTQTLGQQAAQFDKWIKLVHCDFLGKTFTPKLKIDNDRGLVYLQIRVVLPDNDDPTQLKVNKGRKWYLSQWMTKSEFVQTCFKAILTFVEHELRERFLYTNKRIFGPHINVDKLAELVAVTVPATRPPPPFCEDLPWQKLKVDRTLEFLEAHGARQSPTDDMGFDRHGC